MSNYFEELNKINVNDKAEGKGKFTYLSWAFAWAELKKKHPDATYTVYENAHGWNYHTDGRYAWVKTGVTVEGIEHIEYLPVMDFNNKSITVDKITSFDVNKTIQRSLTKAVARHGLGLYIYAGEDLPDEADGTAESRKTVKAEVPKKTDTISAADAKSLAQLIELKGKTVDNMLAYINKKYQTNIAKVEDMTKEQYAEIFNMLKDK